MKNVTINKSTFTATFDGVIANNQTISTISGKANNTGFMVKLVLDQLKSELVASLFDESSDDTEDAESVADLTEEDVSEVETENETPEEENAENEAKTSSEEGSTSDDLDDLDELDD